MSNLKNKEQVMKNKQKISRHEETTFRKASAGTRDHWEVQPVTDAITRQPEGKDNAAVARFPQVAAPESGKVSGDQHYRASQDNGKRKPVFDSLVGKYPVPVIRVPNLLEVIVSEENFLRAIKGSSGLRRRFRASGTRSPTPRPLRPPTRSTRSGWYDDASTPYSRQRRDCCRP